MPRAERSASPSWLTIDLERTAFTDFEVRSIISIRFHIWFRWFCRYTQRLERTRSVGRPNGVKSMPLPQRSVSAPSSPLTLSTPMFLTLNTSASAVLPPPPPSAASQVSTSTLSHSPETSQPQPMDTSDDTLSIPQFSFSSPPAFVPHSPPNPQHHSATSMLPTSHASSLTQHTPSVSPLTAQLSAQLQALQDVASQSHSAPSHSSSSVSFAISA